VYKAEDLKLGREVALKFLPPELASDPIALQRFEREARAASSLDHPNICTIHEVEEHERQPFIVMQLLQGETLRDRLSALTIAHQKMALGELLEIAVQICDALQAAHAKGIIHRDIKPANIFVTAAGQAKILDFGLAKSLAAEELPEASLPHDTRRHGAPVSMIVEPTLTRTGLAMGTAGYMSPEQVRGEKLDARTDIFSFGLVLYEMATGQRAFIGETAAVVHDAVLNKVPTPVRELNSTLPARLVSTIDRGLEKDRERRYQSVTEMRVDLLQLKHTKPSPGVPQRLRWYAAAASVLLILMAGLLYRRTHPPIKLTDKDTLVVTNVTNSTGDPLLDDSLEMPLSGELQEAPYINLLNPGKVRETLHSMNVSADARVTPELARTVCLRTNSRAYVTASIADSGNHYQIRLQAADCHSGKTLAMAETQAGDRSRIVRMLGVAGHDLRAALGEPADSLARFAKPLDEQWSSSLEALKVFSQGLRAKHQQGWEAARPFYTRAIELDPEFSLAYLELGDAYDPRYMTQAFTLRDRLSESFRLLTEADYYERVTGELEKARETYHQWVRTYPADIYAHRNFSVLLRALGQSEDALVEAQEAVHLSPDIQTYNELMAAFTYSSRLSEAKAVFEEAKTRGIEHSSLRTQRYHVAWIENDLASMREQIANAPYTVADKDWASERQGETAISQGRFRAARAFYGGMTRSGDSPNLATNLANFALWDVESGNTAQAKERVQKALAANPGIATMKVLALVSARAGDVESGQANGEQHRSRVARRHFSPGLSAANYSSGYRVRRRPRQRGN
jgi:eukaryotic-like serine/threonine-protein kinase